MIVLVAIILFVSLRKRTTSVELLHDNGAYEATNGNTGKPYYATVSKSVSPPPPIPTRALTNTMSSMDSGEPPGYDVPEANVTAMPPHYEDPELSMKYDPYYETPDEISSSTRIIPPKDKPKMYYDEVETFPERETRFHSGGYDMRSIPSPAAILSGTLQRQVDQRNPDFSYPNYNDGFSQEELSAEPDYDQIYSECLDPTMLRNGFHSDTESNDEAIPYSAIYEDPKPLQNAEAPFKVTANNIIEVRKLGTGQFGHVILAKTRGLSMKDMRLSDMDSDRSKTILVAIKKLKPDAESGLMEAFDKEVKFMSRLNHDNVVHLLGVCTGVESFIMMEYMENGDLNQFLQKQRLMPDTISGLQENEVTPIILLYIGVQIASGMHYLASRRFVHRDLATRNCLVGRDFIVKISDFGMSRSLYESAYYRVQGTLVLPIRWMACETFYGKFSVKSDAWAFGVTLWEIYTAGKIDPYDYMTDEEVIADAIRGPDREVLQRPQACPHDVYEIMQRCWVNEPSMRADFGEIYSRLFMIYTRQAL